MVENMELIVLSFLASIGFAIVFQVRGKDLLLAGLGGATPHKRRRKRTLTGIAVW